MSSYTRTMRREIIRRREKEANKKKREKQTLMGKLINKAREIKNKKKKNGKRGV